MAEKAKKGKTHTPKRITKTNNVFIGQINFLRFAAN